METKKMKEAKTSKAANKGSPGFLEFLFKKKSAYDGDEVKATSRTKEAWHEHNSSVTVIANNVVCKDVEIRTEHDIVVMGTLQGIIECDRLYIAEQAVVSGTVNARYIRNAGTLSGKILTGTIVNLKTAYLAGEVICTSFGAVNECTVEATITTQKVGKYVESEEPLQLDVLNKPLAIEKRKTSQRLVKLERIAG